MPAAPRSDAAFAHTPTDKVPVLLDGDPVLSGAVAIMTQPADRHGALTHPAGNRATIKHSLRWEFAGGQARVAALMDGAGPAQGDTLTIADILLAQCTVWAAVARFEVRGPRLADHLSAMRTRTAYGRAATRN